MDPLEHRVQTMLRERAGDVAPDPRTWAEVERRGRRRTAGVRLAIAGVAVAIVACALVVVPALSRGPEIRFPAGSNADPAEESAAGAPEQAVQPEQATPAPAPGNVAPAPGQATPAPAQGGAPPQQAPPPAGPLVVADGSSVLLTDATGGVTEVLWQGDDTLHCTDGACDDRPYIAHLDVRPGSTADDLVVVYGWSQCGSLSWGSARTVDGDIVRGGGGAGQFACPADAAFAPDGDAFAVLDGNGEGPWRLLLRPWGDGGPEGTGTASALPLDGWTDVRIVDWRRAAADSTEAGPVVLVGRVDGRSEAVAFAVSRGSDGTLVADDDPVGMGIEDGVPLAAAGRVNLAATASDDGTVTAPRLAADGLPDLPLPDAVLSADRSPWLAGSGDGTLLVGDGAERAWTVTAGQGGWSALVEVDGPVTAAVPLGGR